MFCFQKWAANSLHSIYPLNDHKQRNMSSRADQFEKAFLALSADVASALYMEQKLSGRSSSKANSKGVQNMTFH